MAAGITNAGGGKRLDGTAQPSDVRLGKTYSVDGKELLTGALNLTNLIPENVKDGVTIGGVTGGYGLKSVRVPVNKNVNGASQQLILDHSVQGKIVCVDTSALLVSYNIGTQVTSSNEYAIIGFDLDYLSESGARPIFYYRKTSPVPGQSFYDSGSRYAGNGFVCYEKNKCDPEGRLRIYVSSGGHNYTPSFTFSGEIVIYYI